jgi:uncharacterized damage-inducible protein DinB
MLVNHFRSMARNNAWSNHRLYGACLRLSDEALKAPRIGFFPSIHLTLSHILIVDWYYLDALRAGGRGPACYANETPFADMVELAAAQRENDAQLLAWCNGLDEADLTSSVTLVRAGGVRHTDSVHAVLSHLFVHQIHHRGQVHAMLSSTSIPPPQLDEFFLAEDAASRAADLHALGWPET